MARQCIMSWLAKAQRACGISLSPCLDSSNRGCRQHTQTGNMYSRKGSVRATLVCVFSSVSKQNRLSMTVSAAITKYHGPWFPRQILISHSSGGRHRGFRVRNPSRLAASCPHWRLRLWGGGSKEEDLFYPCKATELLGLNPCDLI